MRLLQLLWCLLGLLSYSSAVFDDEAFVIDWEDKQIGVLDPKNVISPSQDTLYILSNRNILTSVTNGIAAWRVVFDDARSDANQRIASYGESKILAGLNLLGRSVIKVFDAEQGYLIKNLHQFEHELVELSGLTDNSVVCVFLNGDVIIINNAGEITFTGKIESSKQVSISSLNNGKFAILHNEISTNVAHVSIFDGTELHDHILPSTYDSVVDFYGTKIIYKEGSKYHLIKIDSKDSLLSNPRSLPKLQSYIPLETDEYLAFEKNHDIEIFTIDIESHFIIGNVHKYSLKYISSTFVLYTEFHANIIDADTGEELKSYKLEETIDHDNILQIYSSTDGIQVIDTLFQFLNNTYTFFINEEKKWTRDISLANITAYSVADLQYEVTITNEEIVYEEGLDILNAYFYRIKRHLVELRQLYNYLWWWLEHWATSRLPDSSIWRNKYFGFEKLLIAGTETGRVIAIDTLTGDIAWTFDTHASHIVSLENVHNKELYVYTGTEARFILNPLTGELINKHAISPPAKVVRLSDEADFLVEINDGMDIILSDDPEKFNDFYYIKNTKHSISGFKVKHTKTYPTWKFDVNQDEEIIGFVEKDPKEVIANIGIILGDRSVLYKYLYPNLCAFGVINKKTNALYIHIMDTITGSLLYSTIHDEFIHENEKFDIVFSENWIVYSYWSNLPVPGQKIAVIDLFESLKPNQRFSDPKNKTSVFDLRFPPAVSSKSFIVQYRINSLAITKTRFGVTTKAILASLANGQILSIPKPILNSRRVEGRPLNDVEKQEFGLLPYEPIIPVDANTVITHRRDILGVKKLISIPTNLESTTIVCSFGLDVYCTRISPSSQFDKLTQSFDYVKLVGSIVLLIITYIVIRYLNTSKRLKNLWVYTE